MVSTKPTEKQLPEVESSNKVGARLPNRLGLRWTLTNTDPATPIRPPTSIPDDIIIINTIINVGCQAPRRFGT